MIIIGIKTGKRIILNEDEIIPILSNFGYKVVFCEDLTLCDQINLFSQT